MVADDDEWTFFRDDIHLRLVLVVCYSVNIQHVFGERIVAQMR